MFWICGAIVVLCLGVGVCLGVLVAGRAAVLSGGGVEDSDLAGYPDFPPARTAGDPVQDDTAGPDARRSCSAEDGRTLLLPVGAAG